MSIPVITIDGTSGCGKGTLAHALSRHLGWHYLDSGALYRIVAWAAIYHGVTPSDTDDFAQFIKALTIRFEDAEDIDGFAVFCNDVNISLEIRTPECGTEASIVSAMPKVRAALFDLQLGFRKAPGLVTDGRDMGTVVFPDAPYKFFLTAGLEERTQRRYKQLHDKTGSADFDKIHTELKERDARDLSRTVSPMVPAPDATIVDTSLMSIEQTFELARSKVQP
jgi:CMP/dCMP kinase